MSAFTNISKGLLAAITLSIIIAFMISLIPSSNYFKYRYELPAFEEQRLIYLEDENLVDFVASFSTEMDIRKVNWKQSSLAIDFSIEANKQIDTDTIYEDLYNVIKKSFIKSNNINEVLLRVFLSDGNKMFVAISAQKADIIKNPSMEIDKSTSYKEFLNKYFGLNYGNLIKQN